MTTYSVWVKTPPGLVAEVYVQATSPDHAKMIIKDQNLTIVRLPVPA